MKLIKHEAKSKIIMIRIDENTHKQLKALNINVAASVREYLEELILINKPKTKSVA